MSPQETQSLQDFLNQLIQARGIAKDPQAEALIASAVAQQPDAAYLLVQRALLMDQALNMAKTQIASLQSQVQATQAAPSRSFLDPANAWGNTPAGAFRPAAAPALCLESPSARSPNCGLLNRSAKDHPASGCRAKPSIQLHDTWHRCRRTDNSTSLQAVWQQYSSRLLKDRQSQ